MKEKTEGAKKLWERYKYVVLVALAGAVLLLIPTGGLPEKDPAPQVREAPVTADIQQEMEEILASPRAKAIYDGFSSRKAVEPLCRRCGYASRFR